MNDSMRIKHRLPAFALTACALAASQAWAQADAAAPAPAAPSPQEVKLDEVIVTAQKVAQPASKTPISMAVITGETLKNSGTNDPRALTEAATNVQIGQESGKLQIAIRGVVNTDNTEKGDPSTAFHVDGVYIGRPEAQVGSFLDLERIEVLRGPQGTLYGRNATAGAVNLITQKPTDVFGGKFSGDIGNHGTQRYEGVLNVPVNGMLALRGALAYSKHGAYLKDGPQTVFPTDGQEDMSARLHALFKFSPKTTWLLTGESTKQGGDGPGVVPIANFFPASVNAAVSNGNNRVGPGSVFDDTGTPRVINQPIYVKTSSSEQLTVNSRYVRAPFVNSIYNSVRSEFKTDLGWSDMTYQFGYLNGHNNAIQNGTFFGFPLYGPAAGKSEQISHELRLNSNQPSVLRWVAGAYLYREDLKRDSAYYTVTPGPTIYVPFLPTVQNTSKAVFGQTSLALTDSLRLITGLRYTHDGKSGGDPLAGSANGANAFSKEVTSSNVNYRVGLDYDLARTTFLYAAVATGYKAGGYNADSQATEYKPEKLRSVSGGIKTRQLGGRLQLNAEAFFYDYKNMQNASTFCTGATADTCGNRTVNVGPVKSRGLDFDGQYQITESGRLQMALGLLKTEFKDYTAVPALTATIGGVATAVPAITFNGQQTDRSPERVLRLGYTHTFGLASGGQVIANVGTRFSSAYYISDPSAGIRYQQPSFRKSDAYVMYRTADDKYFLQAYVRNIENRITIESRVPTSFAVSDPRLFGVRFGTQF